MSDYAANASTTQMAAWLKTLRKAVILTHAKPDGDALGSTVGLARALQAAGIEAQVWLVGPFPSWTDSVAGGIRISKLSGDALALPDPEFGVRPGEGIVVCDTGSWSQVDALKPFLQGKSECTAIIDHHLHGNPDMAHLRLIQTDKAAASHLVAEVAAAMLNLSPDAPLPQSVAEPLYLGLATDTGWLRFSNTTPATLRLAARLIESGVDHPALYEMVEQQQSPVRPRLLGLALSSLRMHHHNTLAVMTIRDSDLRAMGAVGEDTGGFAEPLLAVAGVKVVATFTELPQSANPGSVRIKASLRSKPGPNAVDVAALAARFGGGGHARAAGVKFTTDLDESVKCVVDALENA